MTRQGRRVLREGLDAQRDASGDEVYWAGLAPAEWVDDPGTDAMAVLAGFISITPLHADMTFHRALPVIAGWNLDAQDAGVAGDRAAGDAHRAGGDEERASGDADRAGVDEERAAGDADRAGGDDDRAAGA